MKKHFITTVFVALSFLFTATVLAETRVVILGEDSDSRAIRRNTEIFKRVISQLQDSLSRGGYAVIDEDMLAVKLGFSINSGRPKAELIETLQVANQTQDATVSSRLAVIFAIFTQVQDMKFTRQLKVRVRGDIYDLQTLRALATFEYQPRKAYIIPASMKQCDDFCTNEVLGKNAREVARELGDVLVKKLNIAVGSISDSKAATGAATPIPVTYNLKLIRFTTPQAIQLRQYLANQDAFQSVKAGAIQSSERSLSFRTALGFGLIEEALYEGMMQASVNVNEVRVEMAGTDIVVENLSR